MCTTPVSSSKLYDAWWWSCRTDGLRGMAVSINGGRQAHSVTSDPPKQSILCTHLEPYKGWSAVYYAEGQKGGDPLAIVSLSIEIAKPLCLEWG